MYAVSPHYGPQAGDRPLPKLDPADLHLYVLRFWHDNEAQRRWAETAKKSIEYFEGKQWREEDLEKLVEQGRPALTINKIRPIVMLTMGYFINNRTSINFMPGNDGPGSAEVAGALTHLARQIDEISQVPFKDAEVYLDGLAGGGRGWYDGRIDFNENDLGEMRWRVDDPFSVYPDADADQYDPLVWQRITESRWVSLDEVEFQYGKTASSMVSYYLGGNQYRSMPDGYGAYTEELTPWRKFGGDDDVGDRLNQNFYSGFMHDFVDRARKQIRLIDIQHKVPVRAPFFVNFDTGDRLAVPDNYTPEQVKKTIDLGRENGDDIRVTMRQTYRIRWTTLIGDLCVFDGWSPYNVFTKVPFFPYFRRGQTQGMVEHLTDAQDQINKLHSARMNIIGRASAGGWMYPKGGLDAQQKEQLEKYGSTPGVHIEYNPVVRGQVTGKPEQLDVSTNPIAHAQLEQEAEADLAEISGVNRQALGQVDKVMAGRAIALQQRQAVLGLELSKMNFSRTKELMGRTMLSIVQQWYTEPRIIRVIGERQQPVEMEINQRVAGTIVNNVGYGKYKAVIDEMPLSASWLQAQMEELLRMREAGVPVPDDFIVDASSISRKEEFKARMEETQTQQAQQVSYGLRPPPGPAGSRAPMEEGG